MRLSTQSERCDILNDNDDRPECERRRKQAGTGPRRVLVDFFVGAHALVNGHRMLTLDERLFRIAFRALQVVKA